MRHPPGIKSSIGAVLGWLAVMACAAEFASAQGVRLELRLVPQSGVPGFGGTPPACVFDDLVGASDTGGMVAVSPGVAKRFEVQYRLIDTILGDGVSPAGLAEVTFSVRADEVGSGLWGRARLSGAEGNAGVLPAPSVDCIPIGIDQLSRGLHRPFRGGISGPTPPNNEHPSNGTIAEAGINTINPFSIVVNDQGTTPGTSGAWFGIYSFEFTPRAGLAGRVTLRVETTPDPTTARMFEFFQLRTDGQSVRLVGMEPAAAHVVLESPASSTGCCRGSSCYIALTPSACFANAGRLSLDGAGGCGAMSCCTGDFNGDGVLGVQDLFDYLAEWFVFSPRAELDGMNGVTTGDLFVFLGAYLVGCG